MTNKEKFGCVAMQLLIDIIFYFAVYNAATIIIKGGLDSFWEVLALVFVVKAVVIHAYNALKEGESPLLRKMIEKRLLNASTLIYYRLLDKIAAMLVALFYWGLAYTLIS